jgi:ATP-dependent Lon protease
MTASTRTKKPAAPTPAKNKKRAGAAHDSDDDSIDSHGNIRGLIDYDYDSNDDSYVEESDSSESAPPPSKKARKASASKKVAPKPVPSKHRNSAAFRQTKKIVEESEEEETESEDDVVVRRRARPTASLRRRLQNRRRVETETEEETEEEEDEEETENEFEEADEDEDEYDEEEDEDYEESDGMPNLVIRLGGADDDDVNRMIPRRHNMKKETSEVRKFVELITKPIEDNDIDSQIDQFKSLEVEKRKTLLKALEERPTATENSMSLMFKILTMKLPKDTQAMVLAKYQSLQNMDPSTGEYFKMRNWLDKLCSVPFGLYKEMPVRLEEGSDKCGAFMEKAMKYLDDAVYAQNDSKLQILQFIASKIANPAANGLSLLLVGPPGIGKTSLIKNGIAKALDWPFQFISLGGDSDATTYTGHQLVYESSHSGKIVNSLCAAKSMSTVLLFDELDKISQTPKGEEVQNLLVHLTDPVQNAEFEDKYLAGIPIDLSKVMFVFSANDINKIDRILLDRMLVVKLGGYQPKDKLVIAEQYLLPSTLKEVNLAEKVSISKEIMAYVIENYAKDEDGVRELKRCIESIVQKINMLRMYNDKSLPFYIKDFSLPFVVKKEHIDLFLKKKDAAAQAPFGMYV